MDYQQFLPINTSIAYNSTLSKCNFIAAWHPAGQITPIWVPTYVQPETCNAVYWNTTVKVKLPSLSNTNGTLALYFGLPLDSTLTYANNSGNETFVLYDNGTTVAAATSLNANLTSSTQVFYPGRWNLSVAAYSSTNNATYNGGELILGHANSCSGLCRTKLSTNYNLTDDLRIDYKFRMTGACSGDTFDGEFNTLVGWGGYSNIGIGSIDSPDSGISASFGPGSGADPHFNGGGTSALMAKLNNWSTTGAKVSNMWVNLTGKWPVQNGLKIQTTGNPNYVTYVVASENATMAYSQLNGTTYTNISATNYCIDGTGCNNATVWRLPFQGANNGSLSPVTGNMNGRLLFDQREICSGGTQEYRIDEIQISKFNANTSVTLIGPLEGQNGAASSSTSACAHDSTYVDFYNDFNTSQGYCNLWYTNELTGDMTYDTASNDKWYASTFPQAYFQNSTKYRTINGFTGTAGGPQPYTTIVWMSNNSAAYYLGGKITNTGSNVLTVGVYHNASLLISYTINPGVVQLVNYKINDVAKSANVSLRFTPTGTGTSFNLLDFRIGTAYQVFSAAVYNELTNAPLGFNLTISNSTNTTLFSNIDSSFNRTTSELPTGNLTLTFSNVTCITGGIIPRSTTLTYLVGGANTTAFLLCDGANPLAQTIRVTDSSGFSLQGATVNLTKSYNPISITTTDSSGLSVVYLNSGDTYTYYVSKPGYGSASGQLQASIQIITIPLGTSDSPPTYNGTFENTQWSMAPTILGYPMFTVNASVNTTDSLLYYGLNLTFANGTQLYFVNLSNVTGSQNFSTPVINRTNWNGTLYATLFIQVAGYTYWETTTAYALANYSDTNSSLTTIINNLNLANVPSSMKLTIALFASLVFAAGGGFVLGGAGAGIAFLGAFSFFALAINFVEYNFYLFIVIITIAVYGFTKGF